MLDSLTVAAVLDSIVKLFAVIGGVSVVLGPLTLAWLKLRVHDAVKDAPALAEVANRVTAVETWQNEHADDVKLIPRLETTLNGVKEALDRLTTFLVERGLE